MTSQGSIKKSIHPESTIESATTGNFNRKSDSKKSSANGRKLVCKSTIESSLHRRDFVKRAALATAASVAGIGVLGDRGIIPSSSAKSDDCITSGSFLCLGVGEKCDEFKCNFRVGVDGRVCSAGAIRLYCPADRACCCDCSAIDIRIGCTLGSICASGTIKAGAVESGPIVGSGGAAPGVKGTNTFGYCIDTGAGIGVYGENADDCFQGIGVFGYSSHGYGVYGRSLCTGVFGCGVVGVEGVTACTDPCVSGVYGHATSVEGTGVLGKSSSGYGVYGKSCGYGVYGESCSGYGVYGCSSGPASIVGEAGDAGTIPMVAKGASGQTANLQQWEGNCGAIYAVISRAGSLGLGGVTKPHHVLCISGIAHASKGFSIGPCVCVNNTLVVNGSMAAKTRAVSASTTLLTTDYAILASGTITLTLPPAKTQNGTMLFIKNVSTGTISVAPGGTDTIEGATSSSPKTLTKQYDSLQLISNGTNEWFLLGNSIGDAFVS